MTLELNHHKKLFKVTSLKGFINETNKHYKHALHQIARFQDDLIPKLKYRHKNNVSNAAQTLSFSHKFGSPGESEIIRHLNCRSMQYEDSATTRVGPGSKSSLHTLKKNEDVFGSNSGGM